MKVGIIGYGKIGEIRRKMCELVLPSCTFSIYDPNITVSDSLDTVFNNSDVIFVCAPNYVNARHTIRALESGKHVFCEKPPALNFDELLEVEECYSRNSHLTLIYGFNHRQYDSIQRIRKIIDNPSTGNVLWMRGRYGKAMGDPNTNGWRADPDKSGGGILLDQGIHMLDLMNWFGGRFDKVQSVITNNLWGVSGIEDNAFLNLHNTENNISASLHSTMVEWRHIFSLEIVMEKQYIALNGLKTPSGSYGKEILTLCGDKHFDVDNPEKTEIEFKNNDTWYREVKRFFESVLFEKANTNLPDALEVMRLIKEAYNGRTNVQAST